MSYMNTRAVLTRIGDDRPDNAWPICDLHANVEQELCKLPMRYTVEFQVRQTGRDP